jgi:hypothetical protein
MIEKNIRTTRASIELKKISFLILLNLCLISIYKIPLAEGASYQQQPLEIESGKDDEKSTKIDNFGENLR